jgi:DNA-binding NtrC family response regulator
MTKKQSILYLDDDDINLLVFSLMFEKDFKVQTFSSVNQVLSFLFGNSVDLVLTDQRMTEILGSQFLEKFAEERPDKRS